MEPRKVHALERIDQQYSLVEIMKAEPEKLEQIIDLALMQPTSVHLWRAYGALKRLMDDFVGWHAQNPAINTSVHYDAMIEFIQFLLPMEMGGMDDPVGFEVEEV